MTDATATPLAPDGATIELRDVSCWYGEILGINRISCLHLSFIQ